jgi:hypothetical protein
MRRACSALFPCVRPARFLALAALVAATGFAAPAGAEVPYPRAPQGTDPRAYELYCRIAPHGEGLPANYTGPNVWKYSSQSSGDPAIDSDPRELYGVTGMSVDRAWEVTTGRPDVVIAILDSGIRWNDSGIGELVNKFYLNEGELPPPQGSPGGRHDRNGDGVFNVRDYEHDSRVQDRNGNGLLDPEDLILAFSNGRDDDRNGYTDDICGWDMVDDDNDPRDDVDYGHGTGEANDSCAEAHADRAEGFPGTCPNCMILPVRVGLSFIAEDMTFGRGVVFAVDSGAAVIQEALGTLNGSPLAQAAIEYAYGKDVPVIASAADESSFHQNLPAAHEHTITVNSVVKYTSGMSPPSYLYLNGCTNYGGNIALSVSSSSCSSEATGRGAGIAGLVVSAARNRVAAGTLDRPLTANEVRQILTMSADDIDFSGRLEVSLPLFRTRRFPSGPGWDQYFGYGRANAYRAVRMVADLEIPPEADIVSPLWFETFDPAATAEIEISGYAAARRAASYRYKVEYGRGVQPGPDQWHTICESPVLREATRGALCPWRVADFLDDASRAPARPDDFTFTVRLTVTDDRGLRAESRKTVYLHHDPTLKDGFPKALGASGESSAVAVDLDGDGVEELVVATTDGRVHALRGDGTSVAGWPVATDLLEYRYPNSEAYRGGWISAEIRESIGAGGVAVGDLDRDGELEVVCPSLFGKVYVWESDGTPRQGFPVALDPLYSLNPRHTGTGQADARDRFNRRLSGVVSAPVLEDLDRDGRLEIICSALDGHVYVWTAEGEPAPGWPVLVADPARFGVVDDRTRRIAPLSECAECLYDAGEIVSTPAVGDIDGDGFPEIVVGTNEQYDEHMNVALTGGIVGVLGKLDLGGGNGRVHALRHDGYNHPEGPFLEGWPVRLGLVAPDLLPTVGSGTPNSAALADTDGDGALEVAALSTVGPVYLLRGDGTSSYGADPQGDANVMDTGPAWDPARDVPTLPALGSPVFADLSGQGEFSCVAPSAGLKKLLDVQLPAEQVGAENHLAAWDVRSGRMLPGFPAYMDDLQFIAGPAAADVDGDGVAEIVAGSGGFLVRAYDDAGLPVEGWPKFTGQWVIATPAVGDLDGDGLLEVAVMTRKGLLYVWETPAGACGAAPEREWRTFHHDGQRTGVFEKDTVRPAAAREFKAERRRGRLELSWLAVGDNGLCGAASSYEIRGSSSGVPPAWADAVPVVTAEASKPAGAPMGLAVADPGFALYGIQAVDDAGNPSSAVWVEVREAVEPEEKGEGDDSDLWIVSTMDADGRARPAAPLSLGINIALMLVLPFWAATALRGKRRSTLRWVSWPGKSCCSRRSRLP